MKRALPTVLASLLLCAPLAARAEDFCHLRLLGSNRMGPAHESVASGNTVFLAAGYALVVLDVSNPYQPVQLARLDLDFEPRELAVAGRLLAAIGNGAGLVLFDVSERGSPVEIGRVATGGIATGLALRPGLGPLRGLALVAMDSDYPESRMRLLVFDLSIPSLPELLSTTLVGDCCEPDVAAFGRLAFVAGQGLRIFDLSDPAAPKQIGYFWLSGWDLTVSWTGRRIYFIDDDSLDVIDVSNPANPFRVAWIPSFDPFEGLALGGGYLYTVDPWSGLQIYDVQSETGPPQLVRTLPNLRATWDLALTGDHLFSSDDANGLGVFDVSPPAAATEVARFPTPAETYGIAVAGDRAYLRTGNALRILDVSDPSRPTDLGAFATEDHANRSLTRRPSEFLLAGDLAFVPDFTGLRVVDVSDPAQPVEIGTWQSPNPASSVARSGDRLYLGIESWIYNPIPALRVLDMSNPSQPVEIGSLVEDGWYPARMIAKSNLLVATGSWDCRIFELGAAVLPILVGSCNVDPQNLDVALRGNELYVAGINALSILDVSDPANPVLVGTLANREPALTGIALTGHRAVLAHEETGLLVVDVARPYLPVEIGALSRRGLNYRVTTQGGNLYVADGAGGMSIFEDCLVFEDGFESGDASAWSSAQP